MLDDNSPVWYRAEVINVRENVATVLLIDFECLKTYSVKNLHYLEKSFVGVPRKACHGMLSGVKSKNNDGKWSDEAIESFKKKTFGLRLSGTVKRQYGEVYELLLIDDLGSMSKISDFLIEKGFCDPTSNADDSFNAFLVSFLAIGFFWLCR